ncbi:MAG: hypothetical protein QGF59_25200 [Pirellulaceae bacterium]|nr:hypothetical protein [Pirellulaceae bacterium]
MHNNLLCSLADSLGAQDVYTECKIFGFPARVGQFRVGRSRHSLALAGATDAVKPISPLRRKDARGHMHGWTSDTQ